MWIKQTFGLINGSGVIQNDIVCDNYETANQLARANYGVNAIAVDTTQYSVYIGCKYINGRFYLEDGITEVPPNPTEAQKIDSINDENNTLTEYIVDLDYRLSLKEMGV